MKTDDKKRYSVLHLFCGLGGGALGFQLARARLKGLEANFETLGAVDFDPDACRVYERLMKEPATCADIATMDVAELVKACGGRCPDVVFCSPPCKGMSGLLSNKKAASPKYQAMNRLPLSGVELVLSSFKKRPKFFLIENVPRITTRGKDTLRHLRALLTAEGYVFHEGFHDCGELGGLGQHRRRYLLIARHVAQVPNFVYQPKVQRVRSIGEVLGKMPMPEDKKAGPLHRLPRCKWLTWVRLALISAGCDWRALGTKSDNKRFNNCYRIVRFDEPSVAVTAGGGPSSGGVCLSDERVAAAKACYRNLFRVEGWEGAAHTITGASRPSGGAPSVADPRFKSPGKYSSKYRVERWEDAVHTVTGADRLGSGAFSVADPRLEKPSRPNLLGVQRWEDAAKTVTGSASPSGSNGAAAVSDPRLGCEPRAGSYGVQRWEAPSSAVTASSDVHAGASAIADPRLPRDDEVLDPPPVIVAPDGTWHRPLTTLELAALQGLPLTFPDGGVLDFSLSQSKSRELIGNAVPPASAQAVGSQILRALLAADLGVTFELSNAPVWVLPDDTDEEVRKEQSDESERCGVAQDVGH